MKSCPSMLLLAALPFVGCSGQGSAEAARVAVSMDSEFGHRYFPMTPGMGWIYEGTSDGVPVREDIRILDNTVIIWGTICSVLMEQVYLDKALVEVTYELYGLDVVGNVWRFGEDSYEMEAGQLVRTADSWVAGIGEATPWVAFAADMQAGDAYSGYSPEGLDQFEVVSTTTTATVPAGTFENCLELVENRHDPDDMDTILFAPGVGRISEISADGRIDLVSTTRRLTNTRTAKKRVLFGPADRVRR